MKRKFDKANDPLICEMYKDEKISLTKIMIAANVSMPYIYRVLKLNNIPTRLKINNPDKIINWNSKYSINDNFFDSLDNKNSAYFAGLISADGHLPKTTNDIKVELKLTDIDILEKFKLAINSNKPIYKSNRSPDPRTGKIYTSCSLHICREKLYKDLVKHGIGPDKSKNLRIPKISEEFMHYYIRGWADGDAGWNISQNNQCFFAITSSSYDFIIDLKNIFQTKCNLDTEVKVHDIQKEHCYKLIYSGNCQTRKIFDYLYQGDLEPKLDRKYEKCKNHFDEYDIKYPGKYQKYLNNQKVDDEEP